MSGMTDRDYFAAAALTGLLAQGDDGSFSEESYVRGAYRWADAMLRERAKTNHGASPEARASVDSVAPQPTTRGESDRNDKAAPRPSEGTGDTPKPISGCVSDRSKPIASEQEPVAWGVADGKGLLATSIHRMDAVDMQSDYACDTEVVPLYLHPPVTEPMPKEKRAEVSAEPAAWYVRNRAAGPPMLFWDEERAKRAAFACGVGARPLYQCQDFSQKNLTLTDAEAETLRELRDEAAQYADEIGLCASEVRVRQRIIDGLLRRLGGVE